MFLPPTHTDKSWTKHYLSQSAQRHRGNLIYGLPLRGRQSIKSRRLAAKETLPGSGRLGLISPSQEIRPQRIPPLGPLRARVTKGKGREEKLLPEGPDSEGAASRRHLVLPLSVAKMISPFFKKLN